MVLGVVLSMMVDILDDIVSTYTENYFIYNCIAVILTWGIVDWILLKPRPVIKEQLPIRYQYGDCDDPEAWLQQYPAANGRRQSPINLLFTYSIFVSDSTTYLKFSFLYEEYPTEFRLYNNGHGITLYYQWDNWQRPMVSGGPLNDSYVFYDARFHWGSNAVDGSEHMIDNRRFALELQLMFVKVSAKHDDILYAAEHDSVLMISFLYKEGAEDNPYMDELVSALDTIRTPMTATSLRPTALGLIAPSFLREYYYYDGSLTFPPFTEGVRWIVRQKIQEISSEQMESFRNVLGNNGTLSSNARPVQDLNLRDMTFYN